MTHTARLPRPHPSSPPRLIAQLLVGLAMAHASPARAETDLTALSLEQLMSLTVVGASKYEQKQTEVAAAVSIITRAEIRAFGWRTLSEALASLPGIHMTYDRQYSYLGARGFGLPGDYNTRMLLAINGNRTNDVTYDQAPMGRDFPLDMNLIERIEFIPGPGGAVYGQNAMFGVVNVITRNGADVGGTELAAAAQSPQRLREGRVSWGQRLGNGVDVLLSVSALRSRGEDRFFDYGASGLSGVATGLDGERDKELFARVARGAWSLEFVDGNHRKDDPTGAYQSDPLLAGQYEGDRYTLAQAQFQDDFRDGTLQVLARLFAGREHFTGVLIYGTPSNFSAKSDWRGGELRLLSTALTDHKLMLGIEYQDNPRIEQTVSDPTAPANDVRISGSGYRVGLYAQDEWQLADTLTATLGLRLDRNNVTGSKTSPRVALIWRAAPATTVKALVGRAHRAPNAFERDYSDSVTQIANPTLRGESIDTRELVVDHLVGADLRLRAAVYQWSMRDLIVQGSDVDTGLAQYKSGDTVNAKGVELSADKTWAWGGRLRGSLAFQNARYANSVRLANSPQRLGKLNFSTPLPATGLRLGYELQYDSARRARDGTNLGGYALSNLHLVAESVLKGLDVTLGIRNLFDKTYAHPGSDANWQNAISQDGRSLRLEALYRF